MVSTGPRAERDYSTLAFTEIARSYDHRVCQLSAKEILKMSLKISVVRSTLILISLICAAAPVWGQQADDEDGATLEAVVQAIRESLVEAQTNNVEGFPALSAVNMTLNTTVTKKAGAKFKFLVFSIGATTQTDNSSSLELQMAPPVTQSAVSSVDPDKLKKTLAKAIAAAKVSILNANSGTPKLITKKVIIEIKFAVAREGSGDLNTASLLPIGIEGTGKLSKNQVHSLKLTFGT